MSSRIFKVEFDPKSVKELKHLHRILPMGILRSEWEEKWYIG